MTDSILPSELLEVVGLSLRATDIVAAAATDLDGSRPSSPERQHLIEQILFSRRFVLTYYGALGVFILPFILAHWYDRIRRGRRRQIQSAKDGAETPTSQSSLGSGLSCLRRKESQDAIKQQTEHTPLLRTKTERVSRISWVSVLYRHVRAFLMTQPHPIPALTSPINILPSYGTQLVVLVFIAINTFYLFFHCPYSVRMLFVFADRAGLCFVINLPILYILAAKTNQPLQFLTGWSYEGLNLFHRRLGEWMIVLGVVHGLGMLGTWYTLLRPLHFTLLMFLSSRLVLLGNAALVAYLAIYVTSVGWFRRLFYEGFLAAHIVLQITALAFLFFHYHATRPYVITSLVIWALDRIATRLYISRTKAIATLEVASDKKTMLLFCDIPLRLADSGLKLSIIDGWRAGQHVFVTVPGIGWRHQLQAHPFTIASPAPPSTLHSGTWPLQLTIRAQYGFSRELLEFANLHQHTEVYLDGPYGSLDVIEAASAADRVCLIAGGSGIAVTYPLAYYLQVGDQAEALLNTRTIYENGHKRRLITRTRRSKPKSGFGHMWVRQDHQSDAWIKYVPKADNMKDSCERCPSIGQETAEGEYVADLITSRFQTRGGYRPDIKTELREWASDGCRSEGIVVVVSGPDGLVRDVRNGAADLVRAGYDIDIQVEKFGW